MKPGRKFEFKSLSGVGPLEQVLKTTLAQPDAPCLHPTPAWLTPATWVNGPTCLILGPSFLHMPPDVAPAGSWATSRCCRPSARLRSDRRGAPPCLPRLFLLFLPHQQRGPPNHLGKWGTNQGLTLATFHLQKRSENMLCPHGHGSFSESLTRGPVWVRRQQTLGWALHL